ncbi:MAG: tRNA 4-thiouridine(8) synthase ThiI [Deltaproteobacteria bacterium]|nr:tRNA 4-thiouridine(8) synthase ThiI [Deltaproteobacteria bacterium]
MKALCVFSGGLDSMLASSIVRAQGIMVQALFFETPFFSPERAKKSAAEIRLPLKVVDITERHLEIVRNPKHGYGENMNPCIDCHALMIRCAGELLEGEGANFIITGEVLGQRPMSQNRKALDIVEAESECGGILLRPLSAKRLPMTTPEREGWVDRKRLLNLSGRSRKPQMALAEKFGIKDYPSPAGGCLLTDKGFSNRLKDLFTNSDEVDVREIELLKVGRHFRVSPGIKFIVGRNQRENQAIQNLATSGDLILKSTSCPGPTVLAPGDLPGEAVTLAASLAASYSDVDEGGEAEIRIEGRGKNSVVSARARKKEEFKNYLI